jgi:hypothetical protein
MINKAAVGYDTQGQLHARETFVPVICESDRNDFNNSLCNQHSWPLYLTIVSICGDIHHTLKYASRMINKPIRCVQKGAKNTDDRWHFTFGTQVFLLRNFDITGLRLNWNCADGFHRQCYPLLAAWVEDYP